MNGWASSSTDTAWNSFSACLHLAIVISPIFLIELNKEIMFHQCKSCRCCFTDFNFFPARKSNMKMFPVCQGMASSNFSQNKRKACSKPMCPLVKIRTQGINYVIILICIPQKSKIILGKHTPDKKVWNNNIYSQVWTAHDFIEIMPRMTLIPAKRFPFRFFLKLIIFSFCGL